MKPESAPPPGAHEYLERVDPTQRTDHLAAQHLARYDWACQLLPAKRVLDCSCGLGYGAALLGQRGAEYVLGVDIAHEAIAYAQERFGRPHVQFVVGDALRLDVAKLGGPFDLIVSLETIEHVAEPQRLLDVFAGLLSTEGALALSCPNDALLDPHNPFHLWREDRGRLPEWLRARFRTVVEYAEAYTTGVVVAPLAALEEQPRALLCATRVLDRLPRERAAGWLFACWQAGAGRPAAAAAATLLGDYAYVRELDAANRWLSEQRTQLEQAAARERTTIGWLEQQVANWKTSYDGASRELAECRDWIASLQKNQSETQVHVEHLERWIAELTRAKDWLEQQWQAGRAALAEREQTVAELRARLAALEQNAPSE